MSIIHCMYNALFLIGINYTEDIMKKRQTYKLTKEQRKEIWKLFREGYSPTEIRKKFGITRTIMYKIGSREEPK